MGFRQGLSLLGSARFDRFTPKEYQEMPRHSLKIWWSRDWLDGTNPHLKLANFSNLKDWQDDWSWSLAQYEGFWKVTAYGNNFGLDAEMLLHRYGSMGIRYMDYSGMKRWRSQVEMRYP